MTLDDYMIIRIVQPKKYPRIVPLQINFKGLNVHNVIFYKDFVSWRFFLLSHIAIATDFKTRLPLSVKGRKKMENSSYGKKIFYETQR